MKWMPDTAGFDEALDATGSPRAHYRTLVTILESFTLGEVDRRERRQRLALVDQGVTFTVYGEKEGIERIFPSTPSPASSPLANGSASRPGSCAALLVIDVVDEEAR